MIPEEEKSPSRSEVNEQRLREVLKELRRIEYGKVIVVKQAGVVKQITTEVSRRWD